MELLEVKDILVHYQKAEAISGVSLNVKKGSIVSLIGANGAGKSTILKSIIGLKKITSGEIWFNEERVDKLQSYEIFKKGVALCPEGRRVFPQLTVMENIQTGTFLCPDKNKVRNDTEKLFQRFPILKQRQKQYAGTLSGGEQQMLAIARSLVGNPLLLMLDEPTLGLAPLIVQEIGKIIRDIHENDDISILLVEQNASLALKISEKGYVLDVGQVALEGDTKELRESAFVKKAYLGV